MTNPFCNDGHDLYKPRTIEEQRREEERREKQRREDLADPEVSGPSESIEYPQGWSMG